MVSPPSPWLEFRWRRTVAFFSGLLALFPAGGLLGLGLHLRPGYAGTVLLLLLAVAAWIVLLRWLDPLLGRLAGLLR